jgi:Lon protease-like protein
MADLERIPIFPLGVVLLPGLPLPLHIFEERYREMVADCLDNEVPFGVIFQNGAELEKVGSTAIIHKILNRYEDGRLDILTFGLRRFRTRKLIDERSYFEAEVEFFEDEEEGPVSSELVDRGIELLEQYAEKTGKAIDHDAVRRLEPSQLSFLIAGTEAFAPTDRQKILETRSTAERMEMGFPILEKGIFRAETLESLRAAIGDNKDLRDFLN